MDEISNKCTACGIYVADLNDKCDESKTLLHKIDLLTKNEILLSTTSSSLQKSNANLHSEIIAMTETVSQLKSKNALLERKNRMLRNDVKFLLARRASDAVQRRANNKIVTAKLKLKKKKDLEVARSDIMKGLEEIFTKK